MSSMYWAVPSSCDFIILGFTAAIVFLLQNHSSSKTTLFSSPDPKRHVSYCYHLASVVVVRPSSVVRRKLFQKSSPLKVLDQWKPNLV